MRWKTYSAGTGFVYHYVLRGSRAWRQGAQPGVEYVFHATRDRKEVFPVSVVLLDSALAEWSLLNARHLRPAERYAVAKLTLQLAFDTAETAGHFREPVLAGTPEIEQCMARLGL